MAVDDAADESISLLDASDNTQLSGGGVKRPSTTSQENGDEAAEDEDKQPQSKQRKVDELTKLWTGVHDNPKDFQAWTNLLQHIDQQVSHNYVSRADSFLQLGGCVLLRSAGLEPLLLSLKLTSCYKAVEDGGGLMCVHGCQLMRSAAVAQTI